jgi:hypothetical protein
MEVDTTNVANDEIVWGEVWRGSWVDEMKREENTTAARKHYVHPLLPPHSFDGREEKGNGQRNEDVHSAEMGHDPVLCNTQQKVAANCLWAESCLQICPKSLQLPPFVIPLPTFYVRWPDSLPSSPISSLLAEVEESGSVNRCNYYVVITAAPNWAILNVTPFRFKFPNPSESVPSDDSSRRGDVSTHLNKQRDVNQPTQPTDETSGEVQGSLVA